jgi:hypothetical protein
MKQILLMIAVVALVGCGAAEEKAAKAKAIAEAKAAADWKIIEAAIRKAAKKPTGELTQADLEKVTYLNLGGNQLAEVPKGLEKLTQLTQLYLSNNKLTSVKGLEKLTQLEALSLHSNPDLTKAQIEELAKALPKCSIYSTPKK